MHRLMPTDRRFIRPSDKPSFIHTQRWGVNRKHPFFPDVCCYVSNEGAGTKLVDLLKKREGTINSGGSWLGSPKGMAVKHPSDNLDTINLDVSAGDFDRTEGSLVVIFMRDWADTINAWPAPIQLYDDAKQNGVELFWHKTQDLWYLNHEGNNTVNSASFAANTIPQGQYVHCVITWSESANRARAYVDGVLVGTIAAITPTTADFQQFELPDNANDSGDMYFAGVMGYSYELNAEAISELARAHWAMLQRPSRPKFYSVLAAGETIQIGNATIALVGKNLVVNAAEDIAITKGAIALAGQTVVSNMEEVVAVIKGAVALAGQAGPNINIKEAVPITKGTIALTGQALTVLAAEIVQITKATIALVGRSLTVNIKEIVAITKATIALVGRTLYINEVVLIAKAAIAAAGQAVVVNASEVVQVAKGAIALVGQAVTATSGTLVQIGKATISLVGKALGVNEGAVALKRIKTWLYYYFRGR
jgi:hypothetical protein